MSDDFDALALVLKRAEISLGDLEVTRAVLRKLSLVELDDLCVPPGFNLLDDGSVGSVNNKTPEWQHWAAAQEFVDKANSLEVALFRAAAAAGAAATPASNTNPPAVGSSTPTAPSTRPSACEQSA